MNDEERARLTDLSDELIALYAARDAAQHDERWGRMRRLETRIVEMQALRQRLVADANDDDC
jgi:hypothetical protein